VGGAVAIDEVEPVSPVRRSASSETALAIVRVGRSSPLVSRKRALRTVNRGGPA